MHIIKATAPETQKIHIEHAKIEIEEGTASLYNALITCVSNENFQWTEQERQQHLYFIDQSIKKLRSAKSYFNLPG
jgi:tmRNA-binding protein